MNTVKNYTILSIKTRLIRFLFICLTGLVICLRISADDKELLMQEISYTTDDSITISASWIIHQEKEQTSEKLPVVILLHDYGFNRRDWGIFIPDLAQRGFAVLAIDMREHGQSAQSGIRRSGDYSPSSSASYLLETAHLDIAGALKWLKRKKDIQLKDVNIIGVGLGADIAYSCARKFQKQLRTTVVISPSLSAVTYGDFTDPTPRAVLFFASTGDNNGTSMIAAESMANFTEQPKRLILYDGTAHGLALFYQHPEIKQEILSWLQQ